MCEYNQIVATNVRALREKAKQNPGEFAVKIGISRAMLQKIEANGMTRGASVGTLTLIADACGIAPWTLLKPNKIKVQAKDKSKTKEKPAKTSKAKKATNPPAKSPRAKKAKRIAQSA